MKIIIEFDGDNLPLKQAQRIYSAIRALELVGIKVKCIIEGHVGSMAKYVMK